MIFLPNTDVIEQISQRNKQHGGGGDSEFTSRRELVNIGGGGGCSAKHMELKSNYFCGFHTFLPAPPSSLSTFMVARGISFGKPIVYRQF